MINREAIIRDFPYAKIKGWERERVEYALFRLLDATIVCMERGSALDDEEQLMDDVLDSVMPTQEEEMLYMQVMDALLYQEGLA